MVKLLFILAGLSALSQGHVLPEIEKRATVPAICTTVNRLVTAAKQQVAATAFCSSYLSIPIVTVPKTVSTETKAAAVTQVVTVTQTATITTIVSVTATAACPGAVVARTLVPVLAKRATVAKPSCLATYTAKAILSTACSCLSVPTSIITKPVTATLIVTPTRIATVTTDVIVPTTVTVVVAPTNCQSEKVKNGGFEETPDDDVGRPNGVAGGWTLKGRTTIAVNEPDGVSNTPYGQKFVQLLSQTQADLPSFSQRLTGLSIGRPYQFSFSFRGYFVADFVTLPDDCFVEVFMDDVLEFHEDFRQTTPWTPRSKSFSPDTVDPVLRFVFGCAAGNNGITVLLTVDEISVIGPA